jgi:hypothetical protein
MATGDYSESEKNIPKLPVYNYDSFATGNQRAQMGSSFEVNI